MRNIACIVIALTVCFCASSFAQDVKNVVIIADWDSGIPEPVIKTLEADKRLKIVVPWKQSFSVSAPVKALIDDGRIEPALTLASDPAISYIYEVSVSSPPVAIFSSPDDVEDMIARNQEGFRLQFPETRREGLYLETGEFSEKLLPLFRNMGIYWANLENPQIPSGVYNKEGFFVVVPATTTFQSPKSCVDWILSQDGHNIALVFKGGTATALTPLFLSGFGEFLGDSIRLETVYGLSALPVPAAKQELQDAKLAGVKPFIWQALDAARKEIENYKNSGTADLKTLGLAKERIYRLYNFSFLKKLEDNTPENEKIIFEELDGIYSLLGRQPPVIDRNAVPGIPAAQAAEFSVSVTSRSLTVENSWNGSPLSIGNFSVRTGDEASVFSVSVSTSSTSCKIDIYMDMNHKPMAGVTALLEGADGYMEPNDAWEFALRVENGSAYLYRPGGVNPRMVRKFAVEKNGSVIIPKDVVRGNFLNWGYQAVLITSNAAGKPTIVDFLCSDNAVRQKLLKSQSPHLKAIRAAGN